MTSDLLREFVPLLSDTILLRDLGHAAVQAGREYVAAGRVRNPHVTRDGRTVLAETRGSAPEPYRQRVDFGTRRGGLRRISGSCSCPVGGNCKHVAAALIALRGRNTPSLPAPEPVEPPLPGEIHQWLHSLAMQAAPPEPSRHQLFYILDLVPTSRGPDALKVSPVARQRRKDGSFGAPRPFRPDNTASPPAYVTATDLVILRRLAHSQHADSGLARDDDPEELLGRLEETGRAVWASVDGPRLRLGPPRTGAFAWQVAPDGSQKPLLRLEDGLHPFQLAGPWYADPAEGVVGPVEAGVPPAMATRLLAAPAIPAEFAHRLATELARRIPSAPPPVTLEAPEDISGKPVPMLILTLAPLPFDPDVPPNRRSHYGMPTPPPRPVAQLAFAYGPVTVTPPFERAARIAMREGRLYRIHRNLTAEDDAAEALLQIGLANAADFAPPFSPYRPKGDFILTDDPDGPDWIGLMLHDFRELQAQGWRIKIRGDFPFRLVEPESAIEARLTEGSGIDWFELELGVVVDGQRVDLVPLLLRMIGSGRHRLAEAAEDAPFLVPMDDGRLLNIPMARIRPTLLALEELFAGGGLDAGSGKIAFSRLDAAEAAALAEATRLPWQGGEQLLALGRQLREAGGAIPTVPLPPGFLGTLRPYQQQGLDWLQFLRAAGLGGVLADDMGLGKTVQTLAHLMVEQEAGRLEKPALIVCPTSLIPNWTREAQRFAPALRVLVLHGLARKHLFDRIPDHDLVLSTYPLLPRDAEVLTAQEWHMVILDEAQTIRNPKAETTRAALRLTAAQRICLSGTPLQNHLGELWSLFDFLAPGFLGSESSFRSRYRTPIEKHGDSARQIALHRRVRPFLLRRTKAEVVLDLPPKTEIVEPIAMEAAQRAIYEGIRLAMHARVQSAIAARGLARSGIIILDALLKLRQACCDPRLLKLSAVQQSKAGSAKLDRLMELLLVLLEEGRRVLVFSQFTSMLALIQDRLRAEGIDHLLLTGDTKDRDTPVRRFQAGEVPVFLISLKAGGVGLNLTAADTVIHYDPWWNPAAEDQATDRAHRIGQDRKVFVHRLVTLGSIEEKMEVLKEKKRSLVAAVLSAEEGGALALTEADVQELFEPA